MRSSSAADVERRQPAVAEQPGRRPGGADQLGDVDVGQRRDAVGDVAEQVGRVAGQPEADDRAEQRVLDRPHDARRAVRRHRLHLERLVRRPADPAPRRARAPARRPRAARPRRRRRGGRRPRSARCRSADTVVLSATGQPIRSAAATASSASCTRVDGSTAHADGREQLRGPRRRRAPARRRPTPPRRASRRRAGGRPRVSAPVRVQRAPAVAGRASARTAAACPSASAASSGVLYAGTVHARPSASGAVSSGRDAVQVVDAGHRRAPGAGRGRARRSAAATASGPPTVGMRTTTTTSLSGSAYRASTAARTRVRRGVLGQQRHAPADHEPGRRDGLGDERRRPRRSWPGSRCAARPAAAGARAPARRRAAGACSRRGRRPDCRSISASVRGGACVGRTACPGGTT